MLQSPDTFSLSPTPLQLLKLQPAFSSISGVKISLQGYPFGKTTRPIWPGGSRSSQQRLFLKEDPVVREAKALSVTPATQLGVRSSHSSLLHQQDTEQQLGPPALHPHFPVPCCHSECAQGCLEQ